MDNFFLPPAEVDSGDPEENFFLPSTVDREQREKSTIDTAVSHDPDKTAEAIGLSEKTGFDVNFANDNLDEIKKREKATEIARKVSNSPAVKEFMMEGDNAKVSHDDVDNMINLETSLYSAFVPDEKERVEGQGIASEFAKAFERGQITTRRGFTGTAWRKTGNPEFEKQLDELDARMAELGHEPKTGALSFFLEATKIIAQQYEALKSPEAAISVGSGFVTGVSLGAAGGPLAPVTSTAGGLAGIAAGYMSFAFTSSASIEGGNHYADLRKQGVDAQTASDHATWVGILNGVLEIVPIPFFIAGPFKKAIKKVIIESAETALKKPQVKNAIKSFAKSYVGAVTAETSTEVTQEIVNIVSEEMAKGKAGLETVNLDDPKQREEMVGRLEEIVISTAKAMAVLAPVGPGLNLRADISMAKKAKRNEQIIGALGESAKASKLRERLPEKYKAFVEKVREQGPVKDIQIPAKEFVEYFQSQGLDPQQVATEISPEIAQQIPEALGVGGDIIIPLHDYQTHLAGTEHHERLARDLRLQPGDMTAREAEAFLAEQSAETQKILDEAAAEGELSQAETTATQTLKEEIKSKLLEAGQTDQVAEQQSTLHAMRAVTRAKRLGKDPIELFGQRSWEVRNEELRQAERDQVETTMEAGPVLEKGDFTSKEVISEEDIRSAFEDDALSFLPDGIMQKAVDAINKGRQIQKTLGRDFAQRPEGRFTAVGEVSNAEQSITGSLIRLARDYKAIEKKYKGRNAVTPEKLQQSLARFEQRIAVDFEGLVEGGRAFEARRKEAESIAPDRLTDDQLETVLRDRLTAYTRAAESSTQLTRLTQAKPYIREYSKRFGRQKAQEFAQRLEVEIAETAKEAERARTVAGLPLFQGIAPQKIKLPSEKEMLQKAGLSDIYTIEEIKTRLKEGLYVNDIIPMEARAKAAGSRIETASRIARQSLRTGKANETVDYATLENPQHRKEVAQPIREAEATALREYAKENGMILPNFEADLNKSIQEQGDISGSENFVFQDEVTGRWLKANHFAHTATFSDLFDRIMIHNAEFPSSAYRLEGFADVGGEFLPVFSQPHIEAENKEYYKTPEGRKELELIAGTVLQEDGYSMETMFPGMVAIAKFKHPSGIVVSDIHAGNLAYVDGEVLFIDPVIAMDAKSKAERIKTAIAQIEQDMAAGISFQDQTIIDDRTRPSFDKQELFQRQEQTGNRGSIQLAEGSVVINLFKQANLSTFLHESGHQFVSELVQDASLAGAPQQLKDDLRTLLDFVGAKSAEDLNVSKFGDAAIEKQEKLARAFEAYLREGKAPSIELQSAFRTFKAWLMSIYRSIRDLDIEVSPELAEVFDRMLATDEQIEAAERQNKYQPLFTTAEQGGMTTAEFNKYRESMAEVTEAAKEDLLKEAMREVTRERRQWWKDERSKIRDAVEKEINQQPVYQAIHFLTTGEILGGGEIEGLEPVRLDKQTLVEQYGSGILKRLPRGKQVAYEEEGVHPRVLADLFGFSSGDELIQAMLKAQPRNTAIENETDIRMKAEHGDMLNDGTIEQEAMDAVHHDKRADFIRTELRALNKRTGAATMPKQVIKDAVKRIIASKRVRDINLGQYQRAEIKAATAAQRALADGNYELASEEKRKQLLNHTLYIEARNVRDEIDRTVKYLNKFQQPGTRKNIEADYLDQIDSILERVDIKKSVTLKAVDRRKSLAAWIQEQEAMGNTVIIDEKLRSEARRESYKDMTIESLRGLRDSVKNIEHLGRLKERLLVAMEGRAYNDVVNSVVDTIVSENKVHDIKPDFAPGFLKGFKKGLSRFHAAHMKMEFIFEKLDGFKQLGPVWQALFAPIAHAETFEQEKMTKIIQDLNEVFNKHSRIERAGWSLNKIYVEEVGLSFNRQALLSVALNWGNEGNREALKDGYGWTDEQVAAILDNLTKKEWETVQGIWDLIDSQWEEIAEMQRDLTGVVPEKVEASPFENEHGEWSGGYYPLKYDAEQSHTAYRHEEKAKVQDLFEAKGLRPATKKGHTIERVGSAGQKVKLDLSVISEHLTNVVHDLAYRRAIIDVNRLSEDPRIVNAISATAGKDIYNLIRPWLRSLASDYREPAGALEGWFGRARRGATVVNMGLKITTAIVQPLGYLQSVDLIGAKWSAKGLNDFMKNPIKSKDFVFERSIMMSHRQKTFDRDVRDALKKTGIKGLGYEVQQSMFYLTGLMDMTVAIPTWLGAYKKAMVEFDNDESKSIKAADQAVRMSQSAGGAKDLAQIQTGTEYHRIFTMFYSYFSVLYNLFSRTTGKFQRAGYSKRDLPRLTASMFYLWFAPAIMSELIAQRGPTDDDEWAKWAAKEVAAYPFSAVVGVRDIANAMKSGFDYKASPAFDAGVGIVNLLELGAKAPSVIAGDEYWERSDVKKAVLAAGYWGQLPSRQMWITGETLYDWATGEEEPEGLVEGMRDLFFTKRK